jgi:hypothetical protein
MNINLAATTFNNLVLSGVNISIAFKTVVESMRLNMKQINELRSVVGYLY